MQACIVQNQLRNTNFSASTNSNLDDKGGVTSGGGGGGGDTMWNNL